jgi:small subunit ribosomal protein S7
VRPERRLSLALRWLVQFARARHERTMVDRLASEILEAAQNSGGAVRRKEEVHRMAEANRPFAHYRW